MLKGDENGPVTLALQPTAVVTGRLVDEGGKPVATKGFTATVLVVNGPDRETVTLTPTGENALKGDAKKPAGKGATVSVTLKTADGKSGQARFKL